ncbi:MAG: sugar ABC transporter permease [Anaerolineae bacterium]|nr:sugar ABC transporter permease [Anaerolineae bacterium]
MDDLFQGDETLSARDTRMAWNLLIPTLALLIIVAARPLEETFITSLTDKRFAGTQAVNFIGFDNYTELLTFRLDTVDCRRVDDDPDGACQTDTNGAVRWQSIDADLMREQGFRPVSTIPIGGDRALVLSGTDRDFISSVSNTLYFTIVSVVLEFILGLFIAMVVNSSFAGRGLMRAIMLVPWAIPTVISARLWEIMLRDNQSGIINKLLLDLGLINQSQAFLAETNLQLNALIMVDVWKTAPFMALLILAGLQLIPKDLYEAASVDGANRAVQFFRITLPLLRPTIAVALVFRTLDALRAFDVFNVLLGRRQLSMATYNYETLIQNQDGGYASAIGVVMFILIFAFAIVYTRTLGVETD